MLVIGLCNWTVKETVNTLCLWKWTELFSELTVVVVVDVVVVFVQPTSSFFLKFCYSFD